MYRVATITLGVAFSLLLALVIGLQLGALGLARLPSTEPVGAAQVVAPLAAEDGAPVRSISVSGEGKAIAAPDIVKISLGVEITNASLTEARDEAASKMNAVIQRLKDLGIAEKDIKTVNYSVYPQQDWDRKPPQVVGFQVTHIVEVTIRDVNKAGDIVDGVVDVGATNISGLIFTIDDFKPLQSQAREQAMADAKAKAEQLARLAGVTLGPVITINESGGFVPPPVFDRMAVAAEAAAPDMATSIQGGQLEVQTGVSVVYSIQ